MSWTKREDDKNHKNSGFFFFFGSQKVNQELSPSFFLMQKSDDQGSQLVCSKR
jgi:hypothetical protein